MECVMITAKSKGIFGQLNIFSFPHVLPELSKSRHCCVLELLTFSVYCVFLSVGVCG